MLDRYAHRYFGERLRLCDVTPHHVAQFVAWLADPSKQSGARLSDSTIRNVLTPIRAALATAKREGLIRHNPAAGLALPVRDRAREEDDEVRVLSREQLRALLDMAPTRYRLFLELIASTGMRISEAIGLQVNHLHLSGSHPHLRVRRGIVRGRVEAPKTRHGRRSVPLSDPLVLKLREQLAGLSDQSAEALVFPSQRGTPLNANNLRARMFKPLAEEVGAEWAGFHTLRHTFASLQISERVNLLQLSRVLGHHSAAFTLSVYAHLLEGDQAPALDLSERLTAQEFSTSEAVA